jgi:RNA polymerase sigma factor (sigma-70 family)
MLNLIDKLWNFYDKDKNDKNFANKPREIDKKHKTKTNTEKSTENEKIDQKIDLTLEKLEQKKLQNEEDLEIVRLILAGNTDLFEKILDNYQQQILIYCTRLLNWHTEDGKDATSSTFVKAYINLASFNSKLQFSSWLYRIAHNEAINKIKQNSKYFALSLDKLLEKNGKSDNFSDNFSKLQNQGEFAISRTIIFEENDKRVDLDNILGQLNACDKNILVLFYIQELSLEQIGEILKITTNNAKVRLFRARDKAKKLVKKL